LKISERALAQIPESEVRRARTWLGALDHEVCHAHQHWQILSAGSEMRAGLDAWLSTEQGKAFVQAVNQTQGLRFSGESIEDFANVCYWWYLPEVAPVNLQSFPSLLRFAEAWLPKS
jgi:hypothetical protein